LIRSDLGAGLRARINCPITTLDNDHLKVEPFIPFLEKVSSAIDGALVELVPQGRGIVSVELLEEEKVGAVIVPTS
jgi:hypothetical protein